MSWQTVGAAEAADAGAAAGLSSVGASFQFGANTGSYAADPSVIQANVTQQVSLYFLPLVTGSSTMTLSAQAVAQLPPCSFFTSTDANGYSVELANNHPFDSLYCPVYAAVGISTDGPTDWYDMQLKLTGASSASAISGWMQANPIYQSPSFADPLAYLTPPSFQTCTSGDKSLNITSTTLLYPGTYCKGLTIADNVTVTFQPGLYIITGGLNVGVGSTLNGNGVTFYFTQGGGAGFGAIAVGRGNTASNYLNLTAPNDSSAGGTPSILFWIDPAWTGTDPASFTNCFYSGNGGVIYSKKAGIAFSYSELQGGYYFVMDVAYFIDYMTPLHITNNFSSLSTGDPFRVAVTLVQ